ncbi:MAG: hypothetical protein ACK4GL_10255 [Flavobacteriales bacterium]
MIIKHLKYREIDKDKWDQALSSASNSIVYATSGYLDIVCNHSWEALISEDWQWIMPLTVKRKLGISYLPTPLFVQQLGIFGPEQPTEEIILSFISALPKDIKLIEYQFNHANNKLLNVRIAANIRRNLVLSIDANYHRDKQKLYNTNTNRNIKKALNERLLIKQTEPMKVAEIFAENRGRKIKNINRNWLQVFDKLCKADIPHRKVHAFEAVNSQDEFLAGVVVFEAFNRHILIVTASTEQGKSKSAMHLLLDNYLTRLPAGQLFDFEGSDNQQLALFYKGFGASEANYLHLKINNLPWYLKWLKR